MDDREVRKLGSKIGARRVAVALRRNYDAVVDLAFEWDDAKDRANRCKHGVAFDEARTVFYDDHALLLADPDHSTEEDRFVILWLSSKLRVLLVCHCYRAKDHVIRIIPARRADRHERDEYNDRIRR
jgi:hypothetical protein